jgi:hypothetical protein
MKSRILMCLSACLFLLYGACRVSATVETDKWYELVVEITKDIGTPAKRSEAIAELMGIVKNPDKEMRQREYAAEKLGNLEAIETKDMLKSLAEKLEWTDSTRQLKRITTLAYWKLQVLDEPNTVAQEELLVKLLWGKTHPPPHADVVQSWAVDELSNRGVERALPEIIESIKSRISGKRERERIRLCKTKIELLTTSGSRCEALLKALLVSVDSSDYQRLKLWAIEELSKMKSCEGRWLLLCQALMLQDRCYDRKGKAIVSPTGRLALRVGISYRAIITKLRDSGMSESEIKETGLLPDECFAIR